MTALRKTRGRDEFLPDGLPSAGATVARLWREPVAMTDGALARIQERVSARLAETAAADLAAVQDEQMRALWDAYEADAESDPYLGGWA